MGSAGSKVVAPAIGSQFNHHFVMDRLIDTNCDYITAPADGSLYEQVVKVGLWTNTKANRFKSDKPCLKSIEEEEKELRKTNPLNYQGIQIGKSPIYELKSFVRNTNSVEYHFDKEVRLLIVKRETGNLYYQLVSPEQNINVTRPVNPIMIRLFKPIGPFDSSSSLEIDEIGKIYKEAKEMR